MGWAARPARFTARLMNAEKNEVRSEMPMLRCTSHSSHPIIRNVTDIKQTPKGH